MPWNNETNEMELNDLEKEFDQTLRQVGALIEEQLEIATQATKKAIEISEQHGVPFDIYAAGASNRYYPKSFKDKWGEIDSESFEYWDIWRPEWPGWQKSYC